MNQKTTVNLLKTDRDDRLLYPYQQDATKSLDNYFELDYPNRAQNGLLVMPTGSGKTFTAVNWLIKNAIPRGYQIIWFAHRIDLIEQATDTFVHRAPVLINEGLEKIDIMAVSGEHFSMSQATKCDIYVCSIQSVASPNGFRFIKNMVDKNGKKNLIVVIDEAHHAVMPSFRKILNAITDINPKRILLGLTATPTRMQELEQERLYKMFDCYSDIKKAKQNKENPRFIYEVKLKDLIANGTLSNPNYIRIETNLIDNVKFDIDEKDEMHYQKYGEFSEHIKMQLALSSYRNKVIVEEYIKNRDKYGKTLIFAVNKIHARTLDKEFKEAFKKYNLNLESQFCISGDDNNQEKINDFKNGKYDVFINVQILTEGSDIPDIQTVFLTRQTNSESLLMQMIGRGLRGKSSGGTDELNIVDFYDTWEKFKFWLDPKLLIDGLKGGSLDKKRDTDREYDEIPWKVILGIYSKMITNVESKVGMSIIPNGWYSVINDYGDLDRVLVFDNQLDSYKNIENNIKKIGNNTTVMEIMKEYFIYEKELPREHDLELILNYIKQNECMPDYFEFKELKEIDNVEIANEIAKRNIGVFEIHDYLENMYNSNTLFKDIYGDYNYFNTVIWNTMKNLKNNKNTYKIEYLDNREEYQIVENYFDLDKLLLEVIDEVDIFVPNEKVSIRYSDKPIKDWFGLCTNYSNGESVIRINKLLSSPKVNQNVIKYLIYHELLHASGFDKHDMKFRNIEWKYKNSEIYDSFLDRLFIDYNIENALAILDDNSREKCSSKKEMSIIESPKGEYRALTADNAYRIKTALAYAELEKDIDLEFESIDAKIHIEGLSDIYTDRFDADLNVKEPYIFILMYNETYDTCLEMNQEDQVLIMGFDDFNKNVSIKGTCLFLCKMDSESENILSTIELSNCIEDDEYIYLVKNISDLVGKGVIARLNNNTKDKEEKRSRRKVLVEKLSAEVLRYNKKEWMIIDKISKEDLADYKQINEIVYKMIKNILRYAFSIEEIISK